MFKSGAKDYKAVVTDVNLKGRLSGWDVARQVREINPGCPVIYMTGAAPDEWASHGVPNSILLAKQLLHEPFARPLDEARWEHLLAADSLWGAAAAL